MSIRFEGDGIALNIDRTLRAMLAVLVHEGHDTFYFSRELLADEPWINYDIHARFDFDRGGYVVKITDRTRQRKLPQQEILDVDFEIITDPTLFPGEWKLLPQGK